MTSQELDQHSKIPTTKAKGYILLKKGQSVRTYPSKIEYIRYVSSSLDYYYYSAFSVDVCGC